MGPLLWCNLGTYPLPPSPHKSSKHWGGPDTHQLETSELGRLVVDRVPTDRSVFQGSHIFKVEFIYPHKFLLDEIWISACVPKEIKEFQDCGKNRDVTITSWRKWLLLMMPRALLFDFSRHLEDALRMTAVSHVPCSLSGLIIMPFFLYL